MEGPLDAGAVVVAEQADVLDHEGKVGLDHLAIEKADLRIREASLGTAAEVHDDLDECVAVGQGVDRVHDLGRQRPEQGVEVVDRFTGALT